MNKFIHILIIAATLSGGYLFAQCPRPSKVITPDYKNGWDENAQSKSSQLLPGDEYEMIFIAQAGIKYRVQASAGLKEFLEDNISFQLVVKEVNRIEEKGKVQYKSSEVILYDSELADKDDEAIIVTSKVQRLSIKVKVIREDFPATSLLCAVILIEAQKSQSTGLR
jgi:hypothetical protein